MKLHPVRRDHQHQLRPAPQVLDIAEDEAQQCGRGGVFEAILVRDGYDGARVPLRPGMKAAERGVAHRRRVRRRWLPGGKSGRRWRESRETVRGVPGPNAPARRSILSKKWQALEKRRTDTKCFQCAGCSGFPLTGRTLYTRLILGIPRATAKKMRRWLALLVLPLASGVPLGDKPAGSLQALADQTVEAFSDTQAALRALTTAQGRSRWAKDKHSFQVRAANATHVLDTMNEIISLVRSHTNVSVDVEKTGPLKKPRDSADPQTTTIKFVQKQMELARFNARQGLKKLRAWSTNIPEALAGQDELLSNLSTLERKAISDLVKVEAQLKKTLVTRLEKVVQSQKKTLVKKLEKVAQNEKNKKAAKRRSAPATTTTTTTTTTARGPPAVAAAKDKRRPSKWDAKKTKADKRRPSKAARKGMQAKTKAEDRQERKAKAAKAKAAKEKQKKRKEASLKKQKQKRRAARVSRRNQTSAGGSGSGAVNTTQPAQQLADTKPAAEERKAAQQGVSETNPTTVQNGAAAVDDVAVAADVAVADDVAAADKVAVAADAAVAVDAAVADAAVADVAAVAGGASTPEQPANAHAVSLMAQPTYTAARVIRHPVSETAAVGR